MALSQRCQRMVIAGSLAFGVLGCAEEQPNTTIDHDSDQLELPSQPPTCVTIEQRNYFAGLRSSFATDQVYADPFWDPPDTHANWCLRGGNGQYRIQPFNQPTKYLDAYQTCCDNNVVLRTFQDDETQIWQIIPDALTPGGTSDSYRLLQQHNQRWLDAYTGVQGAAGRAVMRAYQNNDTQRWWIEDAHCPCD
jgi:hypothetical protein